MIDPELVYTNACVALRRAESDYAASETKLIEARRAVQAAKVGTYYYKQLHK